MHIRKLEKIARESLLNSFRLFFDSVTLFEDDSYNTAFFLSVICLEEFGKFVAIDNYLWHEKIDGKSAVPPIEKFLELTYSHVWKQRQFLRNHFGSIKRKHMKLFDENALEIEKQKCLYVGLERRRGKIRVDGKVFIPNTKSKNRVFDQINFVHYLLLDQMREFLIDSYDDTVSGFEYDEIKFQYELLFMIWKLDYKSVVLKNSWDSVKLGFDLLHRKIGEPENLGPRIEEEFETEVT